MWKARLLVVGGRLVVGWGPAHPMEVGAEMGDNADEITETMVWVH